MRIVFAGTPAFAARSLSALIAAGHRIVAVYTQPDRPAGRGRKPTPSPVKQLALDRGLRVCQPESLKDEQAQAQLRDLAPELMVVAAYGLILPKAVLDIPGHGCLNIHASLLPRWRGAAPIQRAIAAGDRETGITIMQMDAGLDTGAMLLKRSTPIAPTDTAETLHDRLAALGGEAICEALTALEAGRLQPVPQDENQACYAPKLRKEEGHIDWSQPAAVIERLIRAFNPWPVAYAQEGDRRIRIFQARVTDAGPASAEPGTVTGREPGGIRVQCGRGSLTVEQLQLPGSRAMNAADLINGGRPVLLPGSRLV